MRYDDGVASTTTRRKPKRSRLVPKSSGQTITIVESDVRNLFVPIHLYPLIDTRHLIAYNRVNGGFSAGYVKTRLKQIFHDAKAPAETSGGRSVAASRYLKRHAPKFEERANYSLPVYYELADAAYAALAKYGLPEHDTITQFGRPSNQHFAHKIMETRCMLSLIELGIKQTPRFSPVYHKDILLNPHCPEATTKSANPFAIPLPRASKPKYPDNFIGWADTTSGKTLRTFAAFEFDTGSEPLDPKSIERSGVAAHFRDYLVLHRHQSFQKRFGITHVITAFVFLSEVRMQHAQHLLLRMTDGHGHPNFRFVAMPGTANEFSVPEPALELFTAIQAEALVHLRRQRASSIPE
jgi:hypothetical protein